MHLKEKISIREWGSGDKIALLIHGLASSSLTWHRLGPDLADLGYHVFAPDLTGHGLSNRKSYYSIDSWVKEILDLNINPDLLIGHSLGGMIAAGVHEKLQPSKTILVDPVIHLPEDELILKGIHATFSKIMLNRYKFNKLYLRHWIGEDIRAEIVSVNRWDRSSVSALESKKVSLVKCLRSGKEVMLMRARGSYIVPSSIFKANFSETTHLSYFPNSGHNIHYDSYKEFLDEIKHFINHQESTLTHG